MMLCKDNILSSGFDGSLRMNSLYNQKLVYDFKGLTNYFRSNCLAKINENQFISG